MVACATIGQCHATAVTRLPAASGTSRPPSPRPPAIADCFPPHVDWKGPAAFRSFGSRHTTMLFYLSDVDRGGETLFANLPSAGHEADPSFQPLHGTDQEWHNTIWSDLLSAPEKTGLTRVRARAWASDTGRGSTQ